MHILYFNLNKNIAHCAGYESDFSLVLGTPVLEV
jgi:hypothetical protein